MWKKNHLLVSLNSTKNFLVIIINAKFRMAQQSNFFRTDMNRQSFHIIVRQVTNFYEEFKMKKKFWLFGDEAKCL